MKKSLMWILTLIVIISMVAVSVFTGCKDAVTQTEETTEEVKEETSDADDETVVAEEKELYIWSMGWWGLPHHQTWKLGAEAAANYFGADFEFTGPVGDDIDAVFEGLETALAKNPTGIIWYPLGIGEGPLLTEYIANGGMVPAPNGTPSSEFEPTFIVGTNNQVFGEQQAKWLIDELGGKGVKVGISTVSDLETHLIRVAGIESVLEDYPEIERDGKYG